jgi:PAS domain S-box-containing protein
MCGNVLQGRFDPTKPFFTARGSFWSPCTTDLLASTTEADREARTRNRCNGEGYESVALIPLRTQEETFGLLQLNDRRRGRLSAGLVDGLEDMADHVAITLAKMRGDEALRESGRLNEQIVDCAHEGIVVLDRSLRCKAWNRFMEEMTGRAAEEVVGRRPGEVVPAFSGAQYVGHLREALSGRVPPALEMQFSFAPEGRSGWVSDASAPLRSAAGRIIGVISTIRDTTEKKLIEERLRETDEKYVQAQKMEAIGRLAGGVAHDVNNVLSIIYGYCDILKTRLAQDATTVRQVTELRRAAERAAGLTRQLLTFSRRQALRPRRTDLNALVTGFRGMLAPLIGEDVTLDLSLADRLWPVEVDPARIEQALMNLAVNARDAMPAGGVLLLRTRNATIEQDRGAVDPGDCVVLAVCDNGIGMSEETKAHLFEPFFTTKEPGKGTGLGLSTVYGIVRQSGGTLRVHSERGRGTTFEISLPRAAESAPPAETPQPVIEPHARGRETILFVEDDERIRGLVTGFLSEAGYAVIAAANGDEAMKAALPRMEAIDLLVTDMVMPGMSGRELALRMRQTSPSLRILWLSGYAREELSLQELGERGIRFLEKPFGSDLLLRTVREILDG